jgi:hypothetical protein
MTVRRSAALGLSFAALLTLGAIRWRHAAPEPTRSAMSMGGGVAATRNAPDATLDSAENAIVSNDAFRLTNAPAAVRYDPADETRASQGANAAPPAPLRPTMTLKAIVGGPPWQAVVDGIPGSPPGTIVRAGNTFDRLVARRVTRDSVVMQGPDTTWVLTFARRQ